MPAPISEETQAAQQEEPQAEAPEDLKSESDEALEAKKKKALSSMKKLDSLKAVIHKAVEDPSPANIKSAMAAQKELTTLMALPSQPKAAPAEPAASKVEAKVPTEPQKQEETPK